VGKSDTVKENSVYFTYRLICYICFRFILSFCNHTYEPIGGPVSRLGATSDYFDHRPLMVRALRWI